MELINTNDENFFDPTPKLKSSPIPILFVSFNLNDEKCINCGDKYIQALFCKQQKYCKKCLSHYVTKITDYNIYLDVYVHTINLECSEHEINGTTQNIQEYCGNCSEILVFKQMFEYSIINYTGPYSNRYENNKKILSKVIKSEEKCRLCRKPLYQETTHAFKLCSTCYLISSGWIESTLNKKPIPILYLPWWYNNSKCKACNLDLIFTSNCQKYCARCHIFYTGCRHCLTTNIIFGLTVQSQCKKCKRILSVIYISSGNSDLDDFFLDNAYDNLELIKFTKFASEIKIIDRYFHPSDILDFIRELNPIVGWIPYSQFKNVTKIAEGGFSIIYKATWLSIGRTVILKRFENSKYINKYFINEFKSNLYCYEVKCRIIRIYGFTGDPKLDEIMLVMEYASGGDLHNYLQKNFTKITWNKNKLYTLWEISRGLENIHNADFIHRDFHSGNILFDNPGYRRSFISQKWKIGDLGLSQPANASSNNEIYGVIPYIAPEIFKGSAFSKESDIYSMGMIMWEFTTGCRPFANVEQDIHLVYNIIDGKRPEITKDTPKCFSDLMKSCWNPDPKKRPSVTEICETFNDWCSNNKDAEQFNQAEAKRIELINSKELGSEFTKKPHSKTIFISKPLSSIISKCISIKQGYVTKEVEFDI
ncbi:kinase-like domain-containing protein [Glomus cerebriforme]|uniref:Kinase-like domain-containing protein n=1 Tax=Glomus cerebriforme TaxID=658196 RepID=A0A397ST97_9GLOM|nr:kinase-like domain-containing protein [Glomus cerebriforme]